jgi:hypothetical protein
MAPTGHVASQVLQRMQISGSIRCCLMTAVSAMSMAVSCLVVPNEPMAGQGIQIRFVGLPEALAKQGPAGFS